MLMASAAKKSKPPTRWPLRTQDTALIRLPGGTIEVGITLDGKRMWVKGSERLDIVPVIDGLRMSVGFEGQGGAQT